MYRLFLALSVSLGIAAAAGCGGSLNSATSGGGGGGGACTPASAISTPASCPSLAPVAGISFSGIVMANQQPVNGAVVQLYAAGNQGNGSPSTALLTNPATTASTGAFTIPGGYTCPSAQTPVFLLAKGGQVAGGGQTAGNAANSSLWLMTALGPCGSIAAGSNFVLNEVTTAASVWALGSFMSTGGKVGASCTNTTGLNNAFLTANGMVNNRTGASPGAGNPSTLNVATEKLNTLANVLASCTQSGGGSACSGLFNAATSGGTVPDNTIDAAFNIAHAPASNVAAIYALAAGSPAFSPSLSAAPPDFMLHNTIDGGGMASPASVAIGTSGSVWVSSYFNTISEFSPSGATAFPYGISGNGINQSYGMALDVNDNVWIANEQTSPNSGSGDVAELNPAGTVMQSGLTSGGIDFPIAAAADTNGNMWLVDYGDSKVTVFDSSGSPVSGSTGWGSPSLQFPVAVAVDSNHNAWVANQAGLLPVTKISADGSQVTNYKCDCDGASGIATDQSDNVWIANYYGNSVSEVNSCGTLVLDAVMGGGLDHPQGIAVDGAGTVWVSNYLGNSISEIGSSANTAAGSLLSPSKGFGMDASILQPYGLAVDASGNIWVSNFGNSTLTEFIGVATPVKTPMAGPPQLP